MARPVWNFSIRTKTSVLRCAEERRLGRNDCTDHNPAYPDGVSFDKVGDANALLKKDRIRTSVQVDQDGTPTMKLYDKLQKAIWQAP